MRIRLLIKGDAIQYGENDILIAEGLERALDIVDKYKGGVSYGYN